MKTTEQILRDYQKELHRIGKSQNTVKGYLSNISIFLRWAEETSGEPFAGTLTPIEVKTYRTYLDKTQKASLSTINTKLAAVQNFCNFLHNAYGNETIKVEKKKGNINPKVEVLSKQELFQFLKYVEGNASLLHRVITQTILNTGMRETEVVDLEMSDIVNLDSTKNSYIIIRSGKGDKYREINISGDYKTLLREWIEHRPATDSQKVFIGSRGTLTANGVYKMIHRLGEAKGLNVYPHMLRHQYLTQISKKCENLQDIKSLQDIAGHSTIETTMRFYIHGSAESKNKLTSDLNYFE